MAANRTYGLPGGGAWRARGLRPGARTGEVAELCGQGDPLELLLGSERGGRARHALCRPADRQKRWVSGWYLSREDVDYGGSPTAGPKFDQPEIRKKKRS